MIPLGKVTVRLWGRELHLQVVVARYQNGKIAVTLLEGNSIPYAKLSENTGHEILPDEFVLHHDVSDPFDQVLLERPYDPDLARISGLFEDTGKRVNYGYCINRPIWRLVHYDLFLEKEKEHAVDA